MEEIGRTKLNKFFILTSLPFVAGLLFYYYTGLGGPILLAIVMVPYAFMINSLDAFFSGELYPKLSRKTVRMILIVYALLSALVVAYISSQFYDLITVRAGSYTLLDTIIGGIGFVLVMEYARRRHPALFYLNIFLIFYALFGYLFPGLLWHPGIPLYRVITAMSVEFETGIFERLPQLALTLIGAFILFVSIAQGFGIVDSVIRIVSNALGRNARLIPQAAVIGSMAVASVSGSGAANAATTGSITIPLMKRVGFKPEIAASIETASSLGGQLMPPIMGISAFVMADFLGVSYFDVIARGYVPALIYYAGVAVAVYLLASRYLPRRLSRFNGSVGVKLEKPNPADYARLLIFLAAIAMLIILMGVVMMAPMYAALLTAGFTLIAGIAVVFYEAKIRASPVILMLKDSLLKTIANFASFVSDLTLLLATLAIMTGLFTITGLPTKVGFSIMDIGAGNLPLLIAIAFIFGYLVGLGLPPVATYILTALIIAPYLIDAGINPWIVHFYAFFIGVFSELSPPTSVTAAVASKIAAASFMKTMFNAMIICIPLFVLMFSIFLHPAMIIEPGPQQLIEGLYVGIATLGLVVSAWSHISKNKVVDIAAKIFIAALSLLALYYPLAGIESYVIVFLVALITIYSIRRSSRL